MVSPSSPSRLATRLLKEKRGVRPRGPIGRWRAARLNRRLARVDFAALMAALSEAEARNETAMPAARDPQRGGRLLHSAHPGAAG
jgi:hypothetical protein